ncbi:MAG TPA: hypothetical protein VFY29_01940 [Terriglobia bacterium]|nr:hypothetical protein [Terriglobia bacterium]
MREADVVQTVRKHIESQFPKTCPACRRIFPTLADYLRSTVHVGDPVSYDAELKDWMPMRPLGTFSLAICPCGSTMSITSKGIGLFTMWRLLRWSRAEAARQGTTTRTVLARLRRKIDQQVLDEAA